MNIQRIVTYTMICITETTVMCRRNKETMHHLPYLKLSFFYFQIFNSWNLVPPRQRDQNVQFSQTENLSQSQRMLYLPRKVLQFQVHG